MGPTIVPDNVLKTAHAPNRRPALFGREMTAIPSELRAEPTPAPSETANVPIKNQAGVLARAIITDAATVVSEDTTAIYLSI